MKKFFPLVLALAVLFVSTVAFAGEWTGEVAKRDGKTWLNLARIRQSLFKSKNAVAFWATAFFVDV